MLAALMAARVAVRVGSGIECGVTIEGHCGDIWSLGSAHAGQMYHLESVVDLVLCWVVVVVCDCLVEVPADARLKRLTASASNAASALRPVGRKRV